MLQSRTAILVTATLGSLLLSTQAAAGNGMAVPGGVIIFESFATSAPPVPVPTLGILAAVLLAGGLAAVALHALRKKQHTFASLAGLGAVLGVALTLSSTASLHAFVSPPVSITSENLGQPISFICDGAITEYINDTSSAIFASEINNPDECELAVSPITCTVNEPPVLIAPGDQCELTFNAPPPP